MGYDLKFHLGIRNQLFGALTTVRTAVMNQAMLNDYMRRFYNDALQEAKMDKVQAYVFGDANDSGRTNAFVELLNYHKIEVYNLGQNFKSGKNEFLAGKAFVVPVQQAQYKMIRTMFESNHQFPDSLFYDATAWALIYSYGLPFSGRSNVPIMGQRAVEMISPVYNIRKSDYAYIFEWSEYYAGKALYFLQKNGIRTKAAWEPFSILTSKGKRSFGRGSILIPVPYQCMT